MTLTEMLTACQNQYNAISDNFFTESELLTYVWRCSNVLARRAFVIERTYSTVSVSGTQEYAYPSTTIAIKRVTYDGAKMSLITFREDDLLSLTNSATTTTGTSRYYTIFNYIMALRPIPDTSALVIKVYSYNLAQQLTSINSTLEIPAQYHDGMIDGVVAQMCRKDQNFTGAATYQQLFEQFVLEVEKMERKRKKSDAFATVQNEETLISGFLGAM